MQKSKLLASARVQLTEQKAQLTEQKARLAEQKVQLAAMAKALHAGGMGVDGIAKMAGLNVADVADLLKKDREEQQ